MYLSATILTLGELIVVK